MATKSSKMTTTEAREAFSEVLNRAAFGKERVILTRHGKGLVAMVSVEDLELLETLEDQLDWKAAERAEAEAQSKGDKPIPWEKAKKMLGL